MAKAKPSEKVQSPHGRNPLASLLSVTQVADIHNVPPATVYRAIQEGRIAVWVQADTYMIPASEAARWEPRRRTAQARKEKEIGGD